MDEWRLRSGELLPRRRHEYLQYLRKRYARFGDRLVQFLIEQIVERSRFRRICTKVLRRPGLSEEQMHGALLRFLSSEGVDAFFERVEREEPSPAPDACAPGSEETGERRSGQDRRTGKDRRQRVETVFVNRRFGGERRSGRDRRAS